VILLDRVSFSYDLDTPWERPVLHDICLQINAGDSLLVTGSNGSGKSTLAWLLSGRLVPTAGDILFEGKSLQQAPRGTVGLSFQHPRLQMFRPTVAEDIRFGTNTNGNIDQLLSLVGLVPTLKTRQLDELSGGEQRRVALAGLLARRPRLLVLDEPLAGLDWQARQQVSSALARIRRETGTATVLVSHDLEDISALANHHVLLQEGRITSERREHQAVVSGTPFFSPPTGSSHPTGKKTKKHAKNSFTLPRCLPRESPLHRTQTHVKLVILAMLSIALAFRPSWTGIAIFSLFLGGGLALARVPWNARPRLPGWFWGGLAIGGFFSTLGGGEPVVSLGPVTVELGGFLPWLQLTLLALELLLAAALLVWTTPIADLAPGLTRLLAPLRRLRIPVDDLVTVIFMSIRSFPLIFHELHTLQSAWQMRQPSTSTTINERILRGHDFLVTGLSALIRQGRDMAETLERRGKPVLTSSNQENLAGRDRLLFMAVTATSLVIIVWG